VINDKRKKRLPSIQMCTPELLLIITVRTIYHAAKILFLGGAASSHPLKYINSRGGADYCGLNLNNYFWVFDGPWVGKSPREPLWACKVHIAAEFRDWLKKRFPFVHIILVPAGCTGVAQRGVRRGAMRRGMGKQMVVILELRLERREKNNVQWMTEFSSSAEPDSVW